MKQDSKKFFLLKILGMIFLIIAIFFLYVRSLLNLQTCSMFILISLAIILFTKEKKTDNKFDEIKLSNIQITLVIVLLILVTFIITNGIDFDIFIILILIELIILEEFFKKYLNPNLQMRLNIFVYIMFVLFMIIIVKKIINLSIMYLD